MKITLVKSDYFTYEISMFWFLSVLFLKNKTLTLIIDYLIMNVSCYTEILHVLKPSFQECLHFQLLSNGNLIKCPLFMILQLVHF